MSKLGLQQDWRPSRPADGLRRRDRVRRAVQNFVLAVCTGGGALLGLMLAFPPDVDPVSGSIWDELGTVLIPALAPSLVGMTAGAALGLGLCLVVPGLRTPKGLSSR